jgi:hypothetical protein
MPHNCVMFEEINVIKLSQNRITQNEGNPMKTTYRSPVLTVYGTVSKLTESGVKSTSSDAGGSSKSLYTPK